MFCGCTKKKKKQNFTLTPNQLANYARQFRFPPQDILLYKARFDKMANGGPFSMEQFRVKMGLLGIGQSQALADRIFVTMNAKSNGLVTFDEYLSYLNVLMHGTDQEKAIQSFKLITMRKKSYIDYKAFESFFVSMRTMYNMITGTEVDTNEDQILKVFNSLDLNSDGIIQLEEYQTTMKQNKHLFEWFEVLNKGITTQKEPIQIETYSMEALFKEGIDIIEEELVICLKMLQGQIPNKEPDLYERRVLGSKMYFKKNTWHGGPRMVVTDSPRKVLGDQGITTSTDIPFFLPQDLDEGPRMDINEGPRKSLGDDPITHSMDITCFTEGDTSANMVTTETQAGQNDQVHEACEKIVKALSYVAELRNEQEAEDEIATGRERGLSNTSLTREPGNSSTGHLRERRASTTNIPKLTRSETISRVHWGDENWSLILNMMSGIQKAVRSTTAILESNSDIEPTDFTETDLYNNLLSIHPARYKNSSGTQCTFRDYAPKVFSMLRKHFGIQDADYIKSLGVQAILNSLFMSEYSSLQEQFSSGKSGQFFYYSDDGKYVIKTMSNSEYGFFKRILKNYYEHMIENRNTLVCRIYGFHKILYKNKGSNQKIKFIVMGNTFNSDLDIHRRYDLKGSRYKRTTKPTADLTIARKDMDFINEERKISIGPDRKAVLMEQMRIDSEFFVKNHIIDYSLLLGIHNISSGTRDLPAPKWRNNSEILSQNKSELYFMTTIDILTEYTAKKKLEHAAKAFFVSKDISWVPPRKYSDRFLTYMETVLEQLIPISKMDPRP